MKEPSPMPEAVIDSVCAGFREYKPCPCWDDIPGADPCPVKLYDMRKAHDILRKIQWDAIMGCYFFMLGTMFVGVELDGYIHT